ncbi:MAG: S1 family peptidase, partial [Rhodanobacteraceae bacterium]
QYSAGAHGAAILFGFDTLKTAPCARWFPQVIDSIDTFVGKPQSLSLSLLPDIEAATFEVVAAKPKDTLTYAQPLPLDLLPYQQRTDKYHSIGTAFEIGPNRFVTAGHVLLTGDRSLWGPLALRNAKGKVFPIDKIEKFALRRDFVVFSIKDPPKVAPLATNTRPTVNEAVYTVGNALGRGVVIRSGLYTSETPESQSGKWDWISFSAAASPGNSGGPLIDQNGKVIGVVLKGVPNQNLNYALPISEVLNAPTDVARFNKRAPFHLPVSNTTYVSTFKDSFLLPKTLPEFFAAFDNAGDPYFVSQFTSAEKLQSAKLFPRGTGSEEVFNGDPPAGSFPHILMRNGDGIWVPEGKPASRAPLPANGYLVGGKVGAMTLFHLRLPDTASAKSVNDDPKSLMDLVLQTGFLSRPVGTEKVKVTSMGNPTQSQVWTDQWGRQWHIWAWPVPFINGYQVMAALPQPGGDALLTELVPATDLFLATKTFEELTNFTAVSYFATLAQWKVFLSDPQLLPNAFKHTHIAFDYGKQFTYASPELTFSVTRALQNIKPDSKLWLGFNFYPPERTGKVVWGVGEITLFTSAHSSHGIAVMREPRPPEGLGTQYQEMWKDMTKRRHPFDAKAFSHGGATRIFSDVPSAHGLGQSRSVRYGVYVSLPGTQTQATMKKRLGFLLSGMKVSAS